MSSIDPRFPDWFVPECPPNGSADADGIIFRFVAAIPAGPEEFLSYFETGERPNAHACQRCGLSVFRNAGDVRDLLRHLWKNFPDKSYGPHIVRRELEPADGKLKKTGARGHHSWWAYEGVERHASFEFVETVTEK